MRIATWTLSVLDSLESFGGEINRLKCFRTPPIQGTCIFSCCTENSYTILHIIITLLNYPPQTSLYSRTFYFGYVCGLHVWTVLIGHPFMIFMPGGRTYPDIPSISGLFLVETTQLRKQLEILYPFHFSRRLQ